MWAGIGKNEAHVREQKEKERPAVLGEAGGVWAQARNGRRGCGLGWGKTREGAYPEIWYLPKFRDGMHRLVFDLSSKIPPRLLGFSHSHRGDRAEMTGREALQMASGIGRNTSLFATAVVERRLSLAAQRPAVACPKQDVAQ